MRTLGNIIWHIPFCGFLSALLAFLLGIIFIVTVIGAPIGFGLLQFSKFLLSPFSSAMVNKKDLNIQENNQLWATFGFIARIIYFPIGLILIICTVFQLFGLFISIVGIPVALVMAKSLGTYWNPVGKVCVPIAVQQELEQRKDKEQVQKHLG